MTSPKVVDPRAATINITPRTGALDLDLAGLWRQRELAWFFVWRQIKVRYKQTAIGAAWAVLQPLLTMVVFTLFFGRLAKVPSEGLPYPVFYFGGLVLWTYFANALQTATNVMVDQQRVITRVYFPRLILPISAVLAAALDLAIGTVVMILLNIGFGYWPSWVTLTLPVHALLAIVLAMGAGFWLSALNAIYRDARYGVGLLIQLWLFASPVAYGVDLVPERWEVLYRLNPMVSAIQGFRWAATGSGEAPSLPAVALSWAVALALVVTGLIYFNRQESSLIDVV